MKTKKKIIKKWKIDRNMVYCQDEEFIVSYGTDERIKQICDFLNSLKEEVTENVV